MADRDDTSTPRSGRPRTGTSNPARTETQRSASGAAERRDRFDLSLMHTPIALAIEAERTELLRAHAVLMCLAEVLLHVKSKNAASWADSAKLAAQLVDESVERLDLVRIGPMMEEARDRRASTYEIPEKSKAGPGGKDQVKEEAPPYSC
jgi:hypothetical protein